MVEEPIPRRTLLKAGGAGLLVVLAVGGPRAVKWPGGRGGPSADPTLVSPTTPTVPEADTPTIPAGTTEAPPATTAPSGPAGGRGPTGRRVPAVTPPYATPATRRVSSLEQVQRALSQARGGEVVEVDADLLSSSQIVFPPGPPRADNVLLRPPLRQRRRMSDVRIRQDHLTVAGFDLLGHAYIGDAGAPHQGSFSGYWRCVQARSTFLVLTVRDAFLVECVGYEDDFDSDSRVTVYGYERWAVDRLLIDGCWWGAANFLAPGSSAHVDGIQVEGAAGGGVHNITVRDSVIAQGAGVSALLKPNGGYFRWVNNWSSRDRVTSHHGLSMENGSADVTVVDSDINGHVTWTGKLPVTFSRNRLRRINIAVDSTNVVRESGNWPMDPLGDLTELWPECPWRRP